MRCPKFLFTLIHGSHLTTCCCFANLMQAIYVFINTNLRQTSVNIYWDVGTGHTVTFLILSSSFSYVTTLYDCAVNGYGPCSSNVSLLIAVFPTPGGSYPIKACNDKMIHFYFQVYFCNAFSSKVITNIFHAPHASYLEMTRYL